MSDTPRIRYTPRSDTTPETELNALAAVYRFILDCHTKHKTVEPAPEPDGREDAKEAWLHPGRGVLMGGGASVGAVVRMRGGDHVETSPVSTDQRATDQRAQEVQ